MSEPNEYWSVADQLRDVRSKDQDEIRETQEEPLLTDLWVELVNPSYAAIGSPSMARHRGLQDELR